MIEDPTVFLVDPVAPEPDVNDGYVDALDFLNAVSPTWWGNELVKEVTGFDLYGQVGQLFAGDWESYAKAGVALGNLADFCDVTGKNLVQVAAGLDEGWDGRASDAAVAYFSGVAVTVMQLAGPLRGARTSYLETSAGIWNLAAQASNLSQALVDSCLIAAAAAAAGTMLIETGVGAVIGWGIAALEIARAMHLISRLTVISASAHMAVTAAMAAIKTLEGHTAAVAQFPHPAAPYQHPAERR